MIDVGNLRATLGVDISEFLKGFDEAQNYVHSFVENVGDLGGAGAEATKGLTAVKTAIAETVKGFDAGREVVREMAREVAELPRPIVETTRTFEAMARAVTTLDNSQPFSGMAKGLDVVQTKTDDLLATTTAVVATAKGMSGLLNVQAAIAKGAPINVLGDPITPMDPAIVQRMREEQDRLNKSYMAARDPIITQGHDQWAAQKLLEDQARQREISRQQEAEAALARQQITMMPPSEAGRTSFGLQDDATAAKAAAEAKAELAARNIDVTNSLDGFSLITDEARAKTEELAQAAKELQVQFEESFANERTQQVEELAASFTQLAESIEDPKIKEATEELGRFYATLADPSKSAAEIERLTQEILPQLVQNLEQAQAAAQKAQNVWHFPTPGGAPVFGPPPGGRPPGGGPGPGGGPPGGGPPGGLFGGVAATAASSALSVTKLAAGFALAEAGLSSLSAAYGSFKSMVFETNDAVEKATVQFTVMTGSADLAGRAVAKFTELARSSASLDIPETLEAAKTLRRYGIEVEKIGPALEMLGDTAVASGESMVGVATRYAQAVEMIESGAPLGRVAYMLRGLVPQETLQQLKSLSDGTATVAQQISLLNDAFKQNSGAMKLWKDTWRGSISDLMDAISKLSTDVAGPFINTAKAAVQRISAVLESPEAIAAVQAAGEKFWQMFSTVLVGGAGILDSLRPTMELVGGFADLVVSVFSTLPEELQTLGLIGFLIVGKGGIGGLIKLMAVMTALNVIGRETFGRLASLATGDDIKTIEDLRYGKLTPEQYKKIRAKKEGGGGGWGVEEEEKPKSYKEMIRGVFDSANTKMAELRKDAQRKMGEQGLSEPPRGPKNKPIGIAENAIERIRETASQTDALARAEINLMASDNKLAQTMISNSIRILQARTALAQQTIMAEANVQAAMMDLGGSTLEAEIVAGDARHKAAMVGLQGERAVLDLKLEGARKELESVKEIGAAEKKADENHLASLRAQRAEYQDTAPPKKLPGGPTIQAGAGTSPPTVSALTESIQETSVSSKALLGDLQAISALAESISPVTLVPKEAVLATASMRDKVIDIGSAVSDIASKQSNVTQAVEETGKSYGLILGTARKDQALKNQADVATANMAAKAKDHAAAVDTAKTNMILLNIEAASLNVKARELAGLDDARIRKNAVLLGQLNAQTTASTLLQKAMMDVDETTPGGEAARRADLQLDLAAAQKLMRLQAEPGLREETGRLREQQAERLRELDLSSAEGKKAAAEDELGTTQQIIELRLSGEKAITEAIKRRRAAEESREPVVRPGILSLNLQKSLEDSRLTVKLAEKETEKHGLGLNAKRQAEALQAVGKQKAAEAVLFNARAQAARIDLEMQRATTEAGIANSQRSLAAVQLFSQASIKGNQGVLAQKQYELSLLAQAAGTEEGQRKLKEQILGIQNDITKAQNDYTAAAARSVAEVAQLEGALSRARKTAEDASTTSLAENSISNLKEISVTMTGWETIFEALKAGGSAAAHFMKLAGWGGSEYNAHRAYNPGKMGGQTVESFMAAFGKGMHEFTKWKREQREVAGNFNRAVDGMANAVDHAAQKIKKAEDVLESASISVTRAELGLEKRKLLQGPPREMPSLSDQLQAQLDKDRLPVTRQTLELEREMIQLKLAGFSDKQIERMTKAQRADAERAALEFRLKEIAIELQLLDLKEQSIPQDQEEIELQRQQNNLRIKEIELELQRLDLLEREIKARITLSNSAASGPPGVEAGWVTTLGGGSGERILRGGTQGRAVTPGEAGGSGERIQQFAEGGLVTKPTLALIGEAGPEVVIPLARMPKGRGSGKGDVNVTVNNPIMADQTMVNRLAQQVMDRVRASEGRKGPMR